MQASVAVDSCNERGNMTQSKPSRNTHKMCMKFLIKGEEGKKIFDAMPIPDESSTSLNKPIEKIIEQFSNQEDMYIVTISVNSDSLDAAKILSKIRDNVLSECDDSVLMLEDGPSEKFGRALFELIATFERRFRELLIVSICSETSSLDDKLIGDLEKKNLGELFEIVFTDQEFNNKVKSVVNDKKSRRFEKKDLAKTIGQMEENTLWSQYFNDDWLSTVAEEHETIRIFRNDVMHAHRMSYKDYRRARTLAERANREMSRVIYIRSTHVNFTSFRKVASGFAKSISKIMAQIDLRGMAKAVQTMQSAIAASTLGIAQQSTATAEAIHPFLDSLSAINAHNIIPNSLGDDYLGGYKNDFTDSGEDLSFGDAQTDLHAYPPEADEREQPESKSVEDEDESSHKE